MHKAKLKYALALALLLCVCATGASVFYTKRMRNEGAAPGMSQKPELGKTADGEWVASFFPELEERTSKVDLPRLKARDYADDHLEVRYWYDSRPDIINGFVIRRVHNEWSALGLRQARNPWPSPVLQETLGPPKSGWDSLWKQLTDAGVLVLPDGDQIKCYRPVLDGGAIVIEVLSNKTYRTYRYSNPSLGACEQAKQIVLIDKIISEEFNLVIPEG